MGSRINFLEVDRLICTASGYRQVNVRLSREREKCVYVPMILIHVTPASVAKISSRFYDATVGFSLAVKFCGKPLPQCNGDRNVG